MLFYLLLLAVVAVAQPFFSFNCSKTNRVACFTGTVRFFVISNFE